MNFKSFIKSLPHFFQFREPRLLRLSVSSLILTQKEVLIIAWAGQRASFINIPSIHKHFYQSEGAFIFPIDKDCREIKVVVGNLWRRKKYSTQIRAIALDDATFKLLLQNLDDVSSLTLKKDLWRRLEISDPLINSITRSSIITMSKPQIKKRKIQVKTSIELNSELFNYTQL